jgi:small subunit ribosomal protein S6
MKKDFEIMLILNPALSDEESATSIENIKQLVGKGGGTISQEDRWGTRHLSYPIKKRGKRYLEGTYHLMYAEIESSELQSIDRQLRLSESLLRFMIVRGEKPKKEEPVKKIRKDATEEVPSDGVVTEEVPSDAVATEEVPSDAVVTEEVPSDAVVTEEVPSDAVVTEEGLGGRTDISAKDEK